MVTLVTLQNKPTKELQFYLSTTTKSVILKKLNNNKAKDHHETIEILGIIFYEGLKRTNEMNKIMEKIENHIRKLKQRNLSLHGKAILLSIIIIAKMTYVSNIFQIHESM